MMLIDLNLQLFYFYFLYRVYMNYIKQYTQFSCVKKEKTEFYRVLVVNKLTFSDCAESLRHSL